ncbi:hypothetical protein [Clostridium butyricum]|uniref:Uncharacterized protein n=2 Tax=Clostridium butyricum TaxID=1492 RepID=A0AAP9RBY4_CLOBU|nr:hypothetical protein [Clostridium butyricum]MBZ5745722.1 hypothetical protein [Clostridium butyricum]MDI9210751.1 hypothetical protein [Clostridium butyricum]QMW89734.1 hypothetical protein FF104_01895 [Clostridium butyricum]
MFKSNKIKIIKILPIIICIILQIVSISIRAPKINNENYKNSDATYHVLLTMKAYDETPYSVHKFLPIVSLGGAMDKEIKWRATIPDK